MQENSFTANIGVLNYVAGRNHIFYKGLDSIDGDILVQSYTIMFVGVDDIGTVPTTPTA